VKKTIRMPKKKLDKWLRALRSGQFKQGQGTLHDPDTHSFCCLGVLQYCLSRGKVELDEEDFDRTFRVLPSKDWANKHGLAELRRTASPKEKDFNPILDFGPNDGVMDAATANDVENKTFPEIADALEQCVETY
jgi:hypothetical protein